MCLVVGCKSFVKKKKTRHRQDHCKKLCSFLYFHLQTEFLEVKELTVKNITLHVRVRCMSLELET